jgi:uroporphyrinogen decarboxylase
VHRVLEAGRAAEGHVFNLGHGVLPQTDPGILAEIVRTVHAAPLGAAPVLAAPAG